MTGRATHLFLCLLVGTLYTGRVVAQAPDAQPAFHTFEATLTWEAPTPRPTIDGASKRTYWLEGGLIGALVLGATGYVVENAVASSACSDTGGNGCHDYRTVAVVGGAALGFLVGALIGGGHTKPEPTPTSGP